MDDKFKEKLLDKETLTTNEAARVLGVIPQRVRTLLKEGDPDAYENGKAVGGRLTGEKRAGVWFIDTASVRDFKRRTPSRAKEATEEPVLALAS